MIPDKRFYPQIVALSAAQIANIVRGEIVAGTGEEIAHEIATPETATKGALCFANTSKIAALISSEGVICLVTAKVAAVLPAGVVAITAADPKGAFSRVIEKMLPEAQSSGIHPSATIDASARIGKNVLIEVGAVIGEGVEIEDDCQVKANAVIGKGCTLGNGVFIGAGVTLNYAVIGDGTIIANNAAIGDRGFGTAYDEGNTIIHHVGRVIIGKGCYIGANTVINRGFIEDTVIGDRVMVDSHVMIAHNVRLGDDCIVCSQTSLAGSVKVGCRNVFGGRVGVSDHITIGDDNTFLGYAGIVKNVGSNQIMGGFPAVPRREFHRQSLMLKRLGKSHITDNKGGKNDRKCDP